MGLSFAEHLAAFANQRGIETGSITKIAQNPDQSKHLETATLKVYGLDLDLVNLRSEEYADDSRIPMQVVRFECYHSLSTFVDPSKGIWHALTGCPTKGHHNKLS